jgi:hypothetical protein
VVRGLLSGYWFDDDSGSFQRDEEMLPFLPFQSVNHFSWDGDAVLAFEVL